MKRELRLGVVGLGGMGKLYLRELNRLDGVRVTSVVSRSLTDAEARELGVHVYRSLDALLIDTHPDVCCVCTPSDLHAAQIERLLQAGVHVISEKPLCLHAAQAQALFDLAQANGVRLFAAQVVRFSFPAQLLRDWITTGAYGRVLDASFSRLSTKPFWGGDSWVFDAARSGLVPYDLHIHDLDLIISLFGEPLQAQYFDCGSGQKPYAEHCRFLYTYPNFCVRAEAAWFDANIPFTVQWRVSFANAVAACDGECVTLYRPGAAAQVFTPPVIAADDTGINVPASDMYAHELAHFIACIREDKPSDIVRDAEVVTVLQVLAHMLDAR